MRGRVLVLLGAIILLVVVLVFVLMTGDDGEQGTEGQATPGGATPVGGTGVEAPGPEAALRALNMVEIVVAIQDLPRGIVIPPDGVGVQPWPQEALPEAGNYFVAAELQDVIGQVARTEIFRGSPILARQVVPNLFQIAQAGSDAAALMRAFEGDEPRVAISIPLDPTGVGQVAYGIQAGDYVDVILSFLYIDVDPTFQTRMPNNVSLITRLQTGELSIGSPRQGRPEASTLSPEGVLLSPGEVSQRPRLVTQRTVTSAWVLRVGYFPPGGDIVGGTPTPQVFETVPPPPGEGGQAATPQPTATPFAPLIITLAVTPQDALVLTWAVDAQIPITLALRAAGDTTEIATDPVTLDYMIRTYNAEPPIALEFALEPPITSVRRFDIQRLYDFLTHSAGETTGQ
jgi:Flp pilus assembly protein CpaB